MSISSRPPRLLPLLLCALPGCMSLDGFFFNGTPVDEYVLDFGEVPAEQIEEQSFTNEADGNTLSGVWAHQPEPGAPVLLYFHGNAENIDAYSDSVERYWTWGLEVFVFDYRGFGKSEGESSYDGVISDAAAAIDHVSAETGLATEEFAYLGLSLGGFASIQNAADRPPKVLITESMFASAEHLGNISVGQSLPPGWFFEDPFDNTDAAASVTVPYLIMHGVEDEFIQISNAHEVYAAANDPKLLWEVPGADHTTIPDTDPDGYREHVLCWYLQPLDCPDDLVPPP